MKTIVRAFGAVVAFTLLLGFGYTALVTVVAQLLWEDQADGSLVEQDGEIIGSLLLAQPFTDPGYFWPRPSASGYNASPDIDDPTARALSYPSNYGPNAPELIESIQAGVDTYGEGVPVDLVTGSGSALDPHISLASARWQATRVAEAHGIAADAVLTLIDDLTISPFPLIYGRAYVNVLELNLALDAQ